MPSGSKKRKAMKKPRPGEPPSSPLDEPSEPEPGSLEESLIEKGEKMDERLEASAEVCAVDGTEPIGESPQREDSEGAGVEGALTPDNRRPLANDPPERPEMPDSSFTASERVAGDTMFEKEGGTAADLPQEDSSPLREDRSETPFREMASGNPSRAELRPGIERDEDLSDGRPIAIELGPDETRAESFEAPVWTERICDEPFAKEEPMADVASDDTGPSVDLTNYGETVPDEALSGEIKGGLEESTEIPGAPPVTVRSELEENESEPRENQIGNELELEDSSEKKEKMAQDLGHDVDTLSVGEIKANSEALVAETKQDVEQNVEPADASPIDLEPRPGEGGMVPPPKAQVGNGPESDEPSAREEAAAETDVELPDAPPIDIEPADEGNSVPFESQIGNESELAESSVKDKLIAGSDQEGMGQDNVTRRADCVDTVADQGLDENQAAAPEEEQPENVENTDARETETSAASGNIEEEEGADVMAVKSDEDSARVELGMIDAIPETQLEDVPEMGPSGIDAPLESDIRASEVNAQAEIDNEHDGVEMDSDARLARIESEATDDADAETTKMSEEGLLSSEPEMCQDKDQTKLETNVRESDAGEIEPGETHAVPNIISTGEMEQSVVPRIESEIDESGREIGASMDVASRDVELEQVPIVSKGESESEAGLDDFKCEANPSGGEEAETETKPEFNATLVDTQEDEGMEALATEVESHERASVEAIPDMVLENAGKAEAASEQESVADTPLHFDVSIKPRSEEMEGGEKVNPENDSSIEQADVSCSEDYFSKGAENSEKGIKPEDTNIQECEVQDDTEPVNKTLSEPFEVSVQTDDSIADVDSKGTIPDMGPDARSELLELQPGADAPLNTELDQAVSYETESGQQYGIDDIQDQQDHYQQDKHQDRITDSIGKPPEAPPCDSKGRMTGMEPEAAESEFSKLEAKLEDPSELKLEETSSLEFDQGQQHVFAAEKDQLDMQDNYEQPQQQESETDYVAETRQLPPSETNQKQALPFSATAEGGSAFSAAEEVAVTGSGLPADDKKMLDKNDGAYVADAELPPHEKVREAFDAEQLDELKENRVEHDAVDNDDTLVQEKGSSAETSQGSLSTGQDQDVESEKPSVPHVIDTNVAVDKTHAAERKDAQPSFDKQELSNDLTFDVPSGQSEMVEDGVSTISPFKSESSVGKHEPKDRIVCEQERGLDFPFENVERDIGEEEAALSTAAEAGSAITDIDEHPSYQLSEFTGSEQDADIFERGESGEALALEGKESSDSPPPRPPDLIATGPTEHEAEPADARSEGRKEDLLDEEVEWKAAQDFEPTRAHEEVAPRREGLEINATRMLESVNTPLDVHVSEDSSAPDEDATTIEAGDGNECRQGSASTVSGDIPEGNFDTFEPRPPTSKSTDSTGVLVEEIPSNTSDRACLQVASGQDVKDTEGFNQQKTQEASLPVEVPVHNLKQRALDQGSGKGDAHPSREGTLQRSGTSFGCCGMFDLLLGRS